MPNQLNDLLLVSKVLLLDDKKAFDQLVRKYQSAIRRFFLHQTLGNKEISDDLSQETFIKAYLHLRSFKGTARFSTWLYRIGYNVFYDYIKSHKRDQPYAEITELCDKQSNFNIDEAISLNIDIFESLKILREDERTAIILFYMEDFTHEKIATIMKCPLGTVKSYIMRGKEKLANYFINSKYE